MLDLDQYKCYYKFDCENCTCKDANPIICFYHMKRYAEKLEEMVVKYDKLLTKTMGGDQ